jgi:hypothetical protein
MALFPALEDARPPKRAASSFAKAFLGPRLRWLVTLSALPGFGDMATWGRWSHSEPDGVVAAAPDQPVRGRLDRPA